MTPVVLKSKKPILENIGYLKPYFRYRFDSRVIKDIPGALGFDQCEGFNVSCDRIVANPLLCLGSWTKIYILSIVVLILIKSTLPL